MGSAPGKTTHVNYFRVDGSFYLVDLPGYGYAKVPRAEKERWARLMEDYFSAPESITLGVMVVDARHKPTANDCLMAEWFKGTGRPFVVAANKVDKVKKSALAENLAQIRTELELDDAVRLIPFSAEKGTGKEELLSLLLAAAAGGAGEGTPEVPFQDK